MHLALNYSSIKLFYFIKNSFFKGVLSDNNFQMGSNIEQSLRDGMWCPTLFYAHGVRAQEANPEQPSFPQLIQCQRSNRSHEYSKWNLETPQKQAQRNLVSAWLTARIISHLVEVDTKAGSHYLKYPLCAQTFPAISVFQRVSKCFKTS